MMDRENYIYDGCGMSGRENPGEMGITGGYFTSVLCGGIAWGISEMASDKGFNYYDNLDFANPFSLMFLVASAGYTITATIDTVRRVRNR